MSGAVWFAIGVAAGFVLVHAIAPKDCCAALGRAAFAKYGVPDLGGSVDSTAGGIISTLGLA